MQVRHAEDAPHPHSHTPGLLHTDLLSGTLLTAAVFASTPFPTSRDIQPNEERTHKAGLILLIFLFLGPQS